MILEEKKITLKDGTEAIFRSPTVDDAEKLLDYLRTVSTDTDFLMRCEKDPHYPSVEDEKTWIEGHRSSEYGVLINCVINGMIVGNCNINFGKSYRTSHIGTIGIAVRKEYWGLGIGTVMFTEMEKFARAREGVTQMELTCFADNVRAQALYKKMGFKVDYVRHDALRRADGSLTDEYGMIKKL